MHVAKSFGQSGAAQVNIIHNLWHFLKIIAAKNIKDCCQVQDQIQKIYKDLQNFYLENLIDDILTDFWKSFYDSILPKSQHSF